MFRILATFVCFVVAAGTSGDETCAVATGSASCATTPAAGEHSLLQVHQASAVAATKKNSPSGNEPPKTAGTKLQQEKAKRGEKAEKESLDGNVGEGLGSEAGMDPYPDDYDLDTDYPRDDKGTHADTIREVQSATLPDAGDIGRNTKPGLSESWNVDTMFVTDSDGGGHISVRNMVPWGYRSQTAVKGGKKDDGNSGLLSKDEKAHEAQDEKTKQDEATSLQRHKSKQASTPGAPEPELENAPTDHRRHAAAKSATASGEAKGKTPPTRRCQEGSE